MNPTWNRRTFLTTLGLTTAATTLPAVSLPAPHAAHAALSPAAPETAFAFLSHSKPTLGGDRSIHTFRGESGRWTEVQYPFETFFPQALAAHPSLPILYTTGLSQHGVPREARRGCATAISIDSASCISVQQCIARERHWLTQVNRQSLALDTAHPDTLTVFPDGRALLVADSRSGICNVLPIAEDGSLEPVRHVLKQIGPASSAARRHSLLVHPRGHLAYLTDLHRGELCILSLEQQPRFQRALSFAPAAAPAHLAFHPSGRFLLVSHRGGTLSVVPLDPATGLVSAGATHYRLGLSGDPGPIVINPAGDRAYTTTTHALGGSAGKTLAPSTLHTLRISRSGLVAEVASLEQLHLRSVAAAALHGRQLALVGAGAPLMLSLDPRTGTPGSPVPFGFSGHYTGIVIRPA